LQQGFTTVVKIESGRVIMSNHENEPGHGHSVAAWAAVITAIVGVSIGTLGIVLPEGTLVIIGTVLTVLSIPMGPVLAKLGYGVNQTTSKK
jgi:hypothetical protein